VAMYRESRRRAKASLPQPFARPASPWRASCATIAIGCAPSAPSSRHARRSADPILCEVSVLCVEISLDGHAVSAATPRTAQAAPSDRFLTLFDRRVDGHVASGRSPPSLLPKLLPRLLALLLPLIFTCACRLRGAPVVIGRVGWRQSVAAHSIPGQVRLVTKML